MVPLLCRSCIMPSPLSMQTRNPILAFRKRLICIEAIRREPFAPCSCVILRRLMRPIIKIQNVPFSRQRLREKAVVVSCHVVTGRSCRNNGYRSLWRCRLSIIGREHPEANSSLQCISEFKAVRTPKRPRLPSQLSASALSRSPQIPHWKPAETCCRSSSRSRI